jgi:hypothetical protein
MDEQAEYIVCESTFQRQDEIRIRANSVIIRNRFRAELSTRNRIEPIELANGQQLTTLPMNLHLSLPE